MRDEEPSGADSPNVPARGAFAWAGWALVLCLLGACGQPAPPPLAIGIDSWPGYEFARLARSKGYFQDEGVEVKLVEFHSLTDVRRAYERGQLDGMFSTMFEVLQAGKQPDRSPVVSLVTDYSNGADVVLAMRGIRSVRALRGKRIGLEHGSLNLYLLARALETANMDLSAVKLVEVPQNELALALRKGVIDAAVSYPPEAQRLEQEFKMHGVFSSAEVPGEILDVLSFDQKVLAERPKDTDAVIRAYGRAQAFAKAHPDEARRIMAAQQGVSVEAFTRSLESGISLVGADEQQSFFAAGGPLLRAIEASNKVLMATRQLRTPVAATDVMPAAKRL